MNWSHLSTLLWVRWLLTRNFLRRHGTFNAVILSVAAGLAVFAAISGFLATLFAGPWFLEEASPLLLMGIWDGWTLLFLGMWTLGVLTELQRAEMLSLDKLLHLPTTLKEVYLFNFLSSLITLTTITLVPPMAGLSLALAWSRGPAALLSLVLLAAFVLMVAALTYQFRGWLAVMMANKRRRQTVVLVTTLGIVLVCQAPSLINLAVMRQNLKVQNQGQAEWLQAQEKLRQQVTALEITVEEFNSRLQALEAQRAADKASREQAMLKRLEEYVRTANAVLPIGWLTYGTVRAAQGSVWPGVLGAVGMMVIAGLSLRRSYVTTLHYFTADASGAVPRKTSVATLPLKNLVARSCPGLTEPVNAILWATIRSLSRAPEVKAALLFPLIMLLMYGVMIVTGAQAGAGWMASRTFLPLGVLGLSMIGVMQLSANCFGFDRGGFRAYVLSGVNRRDILLAKNLALAPVALLFSLPLLIVVQIALPAPWSQFLATVLILPTVFLMLCVIGNYSSILGPMCQPSGSLKPVQQSVAVVLMQALLGVLAMVLVGIVISLPAGVELLLQWWLALPTAYPVALLIAAVQFAIAAAAYPLVLRAQGQLLLAREGRILETVVEKGE